MTHVKTMRDDSFEPDSVGLLGLLASAVSSIGASLPSMTTGAVTGTTGIEGVVMVSSQELDAVRAINLEFWKQL